MKKREPAGFLRELVERHRIAKPEGQWISVAGDKVPILAPKSLSFRVRPRSYRLDALKQLLIDLGMMQ